MNEPITSINRALKMCGFNMPSGHEELQPRERDYELEEEILRQSKERSFSIGRMYANLVVEGRWPEFEDLLIKEMKQRNANGLTAQVYRFLVGEAIAYAKEVIEGRWIELEDFLFTYEYNRPALDYAKKVLKPYCKKGEKYYGGEYPAKYYIWIAFSTPGLVCHHATEVLGKRFDNPYIEYLITLDANVCEEYCSNLPITPAELLEESITKITRNYSIDDFIRQPGFLIEYCKHVLKGRYYDIEPLLQEYEASAYDSYRYCVIEDNPYDNRYSLSDYRVINQYNPEFNYKHTNENNNI